MSFGAFGSTPAPAPGFSFGSASAPAPASSFSFGSSTPAPGPTSFGFGGSTTFGSASTQAPAPSTGFSFGPTPAPGQAFGSPAFGSPVPGSFGSFGSSAPSAAQPPQVAPISGGTPYSALPTDIRQAIDTIHEAIMKHKRTMIHLQGMAPKALLPEDKSNVILTAPGQPAPLAVTIRQLHQSITALEQETGLEKAADSCKADYETLVKQAVMYGQWQIEALAVRRGVHLRSLENDKKQSSQKDGAGSTGSDQPSAQDQLQAVLDRQMAHVDRLERMPSPYLWQILEDLQKRLQNLRQYASTVQQQIHNSLRSEEPADISAIVQSQNRALYKITARLAGLHDQVENLRQQYRFYEKGENVLEKAEYEERQRAQRLNDRIQMQFVKSSGDSAQTQSGQSATPGAFGGSKTSAPAPFSFGPSASTPASAPTSAFGGFGSSATASSAFSNNPAPAPSTGIFGAPATGGFGASAPAAPASFSFSGSSSGSTPKSSKNKSRSKSRR